MINSFRNFLVEEEKTVFFTFGRMNPPTIGHEKLLDVLSRKSGRNPYKVFLSQSQDNKKNPLAYKDKVKAARKMFPKHARSIMLDTSVKTVFDALVKLYNEGYKNVAMVVGSDRIREFDILLKKYNGKKANHGLYNFQKITIISAGDRDPDADGAEGMSASKMRAAASDGDFSQFAQGMPKSLSNSNAKSIYNAVRKGMGLKEQTEYRNHVQLEPVSDIREAYLRNNLFQVGEEVVLNEKGIVGTIEVLGTNYLIVESKGEKWRVWLDKVSKLDPNEEINYDIGITGPGYMKEDYYKGLSKSTSAKRKAHFKKYAEKPGDGPDKQSNYKPAPGDARAKTKPSKHTLKFRQMYGEQDNRTDLAKKRIDREKKADAIKHDRMMDRARMRDTIRKNKETKG